MLRLQDSARARIPAFFSLLNIPDRRHGLSPQEAHAPVQEPDMKYNHHTSNPSVIQLGTELSVNKSLQESFWSQAIRLKPPSFSLFVLWSRASTALLFLQLWSGDNNATGNFVSFLALLWGLKLSVEWIEAAFSKCLLLLLLLEWIERRRILFECFER